MYSTKEHYYVQKNKNSKNLLFNRKFTLKKTDLNSSIDVKKGFYKTKILFLLLIHFSKSVTNFLQNLF